MNKISSSEIIRFFQKNYQSTNFIDNLKIKYRALICPFDDLLTFITSDSKVGDVGCGSGQFLLLASNFASAKEVFGIEINDRLIRNAKEIFSTQKEVKYDFELYNGEIFPDKLLEMDCIFLIDVLHHVPKVKQEIFLKNLSRKLKPGAKLVIKDIDANSAFVYFNKLHDLIFASEIGNEFSLSQLKNTFENLDIKLIHENSRQMYVYPHYTVVYQKL